MSRTEQGHPRQNKDTSSDKRRTLGQSKASWSPPLMRDSNQSHVNEHGWFHLTYISVSKTLGDSTYCKMISAHSPTHLCYDCCNVICNIMSNICNIMSYNNKNILHSLKALSDHHLKLFLDLIYTYTSGKTADVTCSKSKLTHLVNIAQ